MSESDYKMLAEEFAQLRRDCDTPQKAIAQLQSEGLLDENGRTAAPYRNPVRESACL